MSLRALQVASEAHKNQIRDYTGEIYVMHTIRVSGRLQFELRRDSDEDVEQEFCFTREQMIDAALLHDTIEDTDITFGDLEHIFGMNVALLVIQLTNVSILEKHKKKNRKERKALDFAHIREGSDAAHLIKLIDRLDNLKDMNGAKGSFLKLYSKESLDLVWHIDVHARQSDKIAKLREEVIFWAGRMAERAFK